MKCRHCASPLTHPFVDLGFSPPSNAYLTTADLARPEKYYPLRTHVCGECWLVQTEDYTDSSELFDEQYAYFSSTSSSWLAHAARYAEAMTRRLRLDSNSLVLEIASNDGYLLRNFVAAGIPCLGIEPTASTATAAEALGITVLRDFFDSRLATQLVSSGQQADLIVGNNVFAHVPDINDFAHGLKTALRPSGTITLEFPHLMRLIEHVQFDTVYHEHFSYLSLYTTQRILQAAGLRIYDVEELSTHGGSLRVFACHTDASFPTLPTVAALLAEEERRGLRSLALYQDFQVRANRIKDDFLSFLIEQKRAGRKLAAYGAAAKGNTLLNYAGIKPDLLPFVCDAAKAKQGKFLPGSHIPILSPDSLCECDLDFLIILPWNIAAEVKAQNHHLAARGTQFVTAVPHLEIT